jgi:hypothetical protein
LTPSIDPEYRDRILGRRSTMNARVILTVATLITTLVGATPAAALPYIVNRGLDACGGIPVAAAMEVTANGTPDDPVGIANCPALCEKFVTACRGAVDASVACWKKTVAKFAAVHAATCNVQSGAAKEACQATLAGDKVIAKEDYIDAGRTNGHEYCETTALFSCTVSCN